MDDFGTVAARRTPAEGRLLRRGLKVAHLRLLAALAQTGQMGAAADSLGISQPAASRLAAEAERIAGVKLYERTSRGIALTVCGQAFAARVRRIMDEIGQAERELAEIAAGDGGTVAIGAVTGPAVEHVLPAVRAARVSHPGIAVNVEVATSDVLAAKLLDGSLDFALARRPRGHGAVLYHERVVAPEPILLVARAGHPLARRDRVTLAEAVEYDWVLPLEGTLLRTTLESLLVARGAALPRTVCTTTSVLLTLVMVTQTNAVAPMSGPVAAFFATVPGAAGPVRTLPLAETLEVEPYALLLAAGRRLTPAARVLHELVERRLDAAAAGVADRAI